MRDRCEVVFAANRYVGRYRWRRWGDDARAAQIGYCFVNGKGRDYLANYRRVVSAAVRDLHALGVRLICLPYKKSEDPRKRVFAERFLRPVTTYRETDTHVYFLKTV